MNWCWLKGHKFRFCYCVMPRGDLVYRCERCKLARFYQLSNVPIELVPPEGRLLAEAYQRAERFAKGGGYAAGLP